MEFLQKTQNIVFNDYIFWISWLSFTLWTVANTLGILDLASIHAQFVLYVLSLTFGTFYCRMSKSLRNYDEN